MAAVTLLGSATFDTNSGTKTVTATPAVGDLIVLVTAHTGNTAAIAPTDDNGDGRGLYAQINSCVKASSADTLQMWVRVARVGNASSTVFSHAPGTSSGGGVAVFKVTGMSRDGLNAIRQSAIQSNQSSGGGTPTPVLGVAALTGNALIGAVFNATNVATMTPRSSPAYTERNDSGYNSPTTGLETMSIDSGETATSIAWGGTSGSAFCSMVAELDTTTPPPLEEQSDDWWGGAQKCFVGAAIAGAAAAMGLSTSIAGSFIQNDELPLLVPGAAAGAPPTQRARVSPVFQRWFQTDELPSTPTVALDEQYAWRAQLPVVATTVPTPWADSDFALSPTVALDEQTDWQRPITYLPAVQSIAWHQDEIPAAAPITAPSDGFQSYGQRERVQTKFKRWYAQDELPSVTVTVVDDESSYRPFGLPAAPMVVMWAEDDQFAPQLSALTVDDLYWQAPVIQRAAPNLQVWQVDDVVTRFLLIDQDSAAPLPSSQQPITSVLWVEDEQIVPQPSLTPDVETWQPPILALVKPSLAQWEDGDLVVTAANPLRDDEGWQAPLGVTSKPVLLAAWTDDEIVPRPALLDDETWQPPVVAVRPVLSAPWGDVEFVPTAAPAPVFDDEWAIPAALRASPAPLCPWADDDIVPQQIALDDSTWSAPAVVKVAPVVAVWNQQDERAALPLTVDESYWLPTPLQKPVLDTRVFTDDGNRECIHDVYTHDSRHRVGHRKAGVSPERIGPKSARILDERIGTKKQ